MSGFSSSGRARTHRILWDLHAVAGAICALPLFVMFYAGAFALYRGELYAWADPALRWPEPTGTWEIVERQFERRPPDGGSDWMVVHPFADRPYVFLKYVTGGEEIRGLLGPRDEAGLIPFGGRAAMPDLVHDLHYFNQLGTFGRSVSGALSVFFVFILGTGLWMHWKKLPRALHQLRLRSGLRLAVTDAHTTLGVLGVPFSLMYGVTGAFLGLLVVILSPAVLVVFGGDSSRLDVLLSGVEDPPPVKSSAGAAPPPDVRTLEANVATRWGPGTRVFRTDVHDYLREGSAVIIEAQQDGSVTRSGKIVFDALTQKVLAESPPDRTPVLGQTVGLLTGLHFGRMGVSLLTDAVFFTLALFAGAVMISGNVLWCFGRTDARLRAGRRTDFIVGRATVGGAVGLVLAVPLGLVVTQALPPAAAFRPMAEASVFWGTWALCLGVAFASRRPLTWGRRWLIAAAIASLLAAVLDAVQTVGLSSVAFDWRAVVVDLGLLLHGALILGGVRFIFPRGPAAALAEPSENPS